MRWFLSFAHICVLFVLAIGGCGGAVGLFGSSEPEIDVPSVTYATAGYLAEQEVIRVGWLPVADAQVARYRVLRVGPFLGITDPTSITSNLIPESIGSTSDATLDDPNISLDALFGYQVVALDSSSREADPTDYVWVYLSEENEEQAAEVYSDLCGVDTNASLIQHVDPLRPQPTEFAATVSTVVLTSEVGELSSLAWYSVRPDNRRTLLKTEEDVELVVGCNLHTWTFDESIPDNAIALSAELDTSYGAMEAWFPITTATQGLRLYNFSPAIGSILQVGSHLLQANLDYTIDQFDTQSLAVVVLAETVEGQEQVLAAQIYDEETTSGTVSFASTIEIPSDTVVVRLSARVASASIDNVTSIDEVSFGVVP